MLKSLFARKGLMQPEDFKMKRSHTSLAEKKQKKLDAGSLASHFPEVESIVVSMNYRQLGLKNTMPRTVQYVPGSYAVFSIDCLSKGCIEGGFDFSRVISSMVRSHADVTKGAMTCKGGPSENHSSIDYEVTIHYAQ